MPHRVPRITVFASMVLLIAGTLSVVPSKASASTGSPTLALAPNNLVLERSSSFVLLPRSQRILDTRDPGLSIVGVGETRTVLLTGPMGALFNASVTAAVVNMTVVGPAAAGYWTVWPLGQARPNASQLNVDDYLSTYGADAMIPNLVTVPVSNGGISIYSSNGGHLIIDLVGYYTPNLTSVSGRFESGPAPIRVFDSRGGQIFAPGERRRISIPNARSSTAVVLSVTAIGLGSGYWQVFPAGSALPETSNLNSLAMGSISANQVITNVDIDGYIEVFSYGGGHLIVDLVGVFTGPNAVSSSDGLFVPLPAPVRFVDTRATGRVYGPGSVEVDVHAIIGQANVAAVVLNATVTDAFLPGYLAVTPAGSSPPSMKSRSTSTLNVMYSNQTVASHAIVPVSTRGFEIFTESGGQLIADVAGWFIGQPQIATFAATGKGQQALTTDCVGVATWPVGPIRFGSGTDAVKRLQLRLLELGFWTVGIDGEYGSSTKQAVMAFQKWVGLSPTSITDAQTAAMLNATQCRPSAGRTTGDYFEVNKGKQIAHVVRGGQVVYTFNVSTGNGKDYDEEDQLSNGRVSGVAVTPVGQFKIYKERDVKVYEGNLGTLYRPKFVVGGIAVHGSRSIPSYPASHGCIRVANQVMDLIWLENFLPRGAKVWIHD